MPYLSHKVDPHKIKPGDHVYTYRKAFAYAHHGIYVGGNKIVQFSPEKDASSGSISFSSISVNSCSNQNDLPSSLTPNDCGFHKQESGVFVSCLKCFTRGGSLHLFEYGVKEVVSITQLRSGTCSTAISDPPEEVIHRAMYLLENGYGTYKLFENNCEDFALYCKTGLLVCEGGARTGRSGQVQNLKGNLAIAATAGTHLAIYLAVLPFYPQVVVPAMALEGAFYVAAKISLRKKSDIGLRSDVKKVDVEDLNL